MGFKKQVKKCYVKHLHRFVREIHFLLKVGLETAPGVVLLSSRVSFHTAEPGAKFTADS